MEITCRIITDIIRWGPHDLYPPVGEYKGNLIIVLYVGTKHPVFSAGQEETPYPRPAKNGPEQSILKTRDQIISCHALYHKPMQRTGTLQKQKAKTKSFHLCAEFLDVGLLALQGQRHDTADVHLGAVHVHVQTQLDTGGLDVLQTLLVVGAGTADPDLDLVLLENGGNVANGANDTLEGAGNVGKVGNTTTDKEDFAVGVGRGAQHQVKHGAGVVVGLSLGGSTGVLAVVGQLANEAGGGNGVGIDDGGTTTSNQGPDTAVGVQNGQLEGGTGLGIHVGDELLLLAQLTTEGGGELHWRTSVNVDLAVGGSQGGQAQRGRTAGDGPLSAALELGSLIELSREVEEVNLGGGGIGVGDDHERVNLEVGELAVNVDGVQAGDEVHQDVVDTLGHLGQQCGGNLLVGGVVLEVHGDEQLLSLGVNITDVDTTLVGEENPVTLEIVRGCSRLVSKLRL